MCVAPDHILLMRGIYSLLKRALSVNSITQTCHGLAQLLKSVKYIASLEVLLEV